MNPDQRLCSQRTDQEIDELLAQVTDFDSPSHRIWGDDLGSAEPSVSRTRMTLPMVDATGNIWMLDNVDR